MLPVFLRLTGKAVLVVGGGTVAARRTLALLTEGALVRVTAPRLNDELAALAAAGSIQWVAREYQEGDVDGSRLVIAATDDAGVNAAVAEAAERVGIWCIRSDAAAASEAWLPASGSFDDISVGICANGDPRRAVEVRDAILTGLEYGDIPAPRHRRGRTAGTVTLVGAGPGVGLITVAGLAALRRADVVVADRLIDPTLLHGLRDDVVVIDAGKSPQRHALRQEEINDVIVEQARAGKAVVRLKGGDPFVFGRGGEEVLACRAAGIAVEVIPGVSSSIAAPAVAGIPVTHRGVSGAFTVVSAVSEVDLDALARVGGTLVFLMGVAKLPEIVSRLRDGGLPSSTPMAFIERAYQAGQRSTRTTLEAALEAAAGIGLTNPAVIVVGDVVSVLEADAQALTGPGVPLARRS